MKVETDIVASISITVSLIEQAVIPAIVFVKTFKTNVFVFIRNFIMCLKSHLLIIFRITAGLLVLTKQNVSLVKLKEKCPKYRYF